jgi:hypothetical protein
MKVAFSILILIHALIHLLGFIKAFEWASIPALTQTISKPVGILWFIAFLFLTASIVFRQLDHMNWYLWAFAAVLISQLLIVWAWQDAKFGTLLNVLLLIVSIAAWGQHRFSEKVAEERNSLLALSSPNTQWTAMEELPEIVQKWLSKSGALQHREVKEIHLRQKIQMKMKPGQDAWIPAKAQQVFTMHPPAFHWVVEMEMNPFMTVLGRDQFLGGKGEMLIQLYGLFSLADEKENSKIDEGALQRYLAEIVWFPFAAQAPYIKWEAVSDTIARATLTFEGTSGTGEFTFDSSGRFKRFQAMRYKGGEADAVRIPWTVEALDHKVMQGIEVPTHCQASWELKEGTWTWLELQIEEMQYRY